MMCRFVRDRSGNSAVEWALVLPIVVATLIGFFNACAMYWGQTSLHYAADSAVRCWAVNYPCQSSSDAVTYAKSHYHGPQLSSITFIATAPPAEATSGDPSSEVNGTGAYCQQTSSPFGSSNTVSTTSTTAVPAYRVSAKASYFFDAGLFKFSVPIATTACFPQYN
jgi:Flp pilus assembly protein TadG